VSAPEDTPDALDVIEASPLWAEAGLAPDALAHEAVGAAAAELGVAPDRPGAVVFADDALLGALNARHRGKPAPTNVLAFPPAPAPALTPAGEAATSPFGDVVLAFETIAREAAELGISLRARTVHMIVHGYLHLHGYAHDAEDDAERMESMERTALARLKLADPYEVSGDV